MDEEGIFVEYLCLDGQTRAMDISYRATMAFGFVYQQQVATPLGNGTVLGVHSGYLYFWLASDTAASYWSDCRTAQDLRLKGVHLLSTAIESAPAAAGLGGAHSTEYHNLKPVVVDGVRHWVVMQSANGPCPVIALANALILSNAMRDMVPEGSTAIPAASLRTQLLAFLRESHPPPQCTLCPLKRNQQLTLTGLIGEGHLESLRQELVQGPGAEALLAKFYGGLDVSPFFTHIDGFEGDKETALFALAGVRLVHGWIYGEAHRFSPLRDMSYNEVQVKALDTEQDPEIAGLAHELLQTAQLTPEGLDALRAGVNEGEVCVQFYNNHFSTIVKKGGVLLRLASDISFVDRSCIVFENMIDTQGTVEYVDGNGLAVDDVVLGIQSMVGDRFTEDQIMVARAEYLSERMEAGSCDDIIRLLERQQSASQAATSSSAAGATTGPRQPATVVAAPGSIDVHRQHPDGGPAFPQLLITGPEDGGGGGGGGGGATSSGATSSGMHRPDASSADQLLSMGLCATRAEALAVLASHASVEAAVEALLSGAR